MAPLTVARFKRKIGQMVAMFVARVLPVARHMYVCMYVYTIIVLRGQQILEQLLSFKET